MSSKHMINTLRTKCCFKLCIVTGIALIVVYSYITFKENILFIADDDQPTKYILYWMPMFGDRGFYLGLGNDIFGNCTYKNCYTTNNRSLVPLEEFSAILFHGPEFFQGGDIPQKRWAHQVYVYSNQESPVNTPQYNGGKDNFFNWTMTYRYDSDIPRMYGYVLRQDTDYKLPTREEIQRKKNRIAWFVSNCVTQSKRENLAEEIAKHIPIDIYGRCGNFSCSKKEDSKCYSMVERNYKFYFAAENSLCDDYVTEKLYSLLKKNVIPLVYGEVEYSKLSPPHSVIDVNSFETVDELAGYLDFLNRNIDEYLKYFEWKKSYVIDTSGEVTLCTLCEKLHKRIEQKTYENIDTWWYGENVSMCKYGSALPKIVKPKGVQD